MGEVEGVGGVMPGIIEGEVRGGVLE